MARDAGRRGNGRPDSCLRKRARRDGGCPGTETVREAEGQGVVSMTDRSVRPPGQGSDGDESSEHQRSSEA